jgi:hypothetical protein
MYKRNYEEPGEHDYKVTSSVPPMEATHQNYHKLNDNYVYSMHNELS